VRRPSVTSTSSPSSTPKGPATRRPTPSPPTPRRHPAPDRWFGTSPYDWHDADWMAGRKATVALDAPMTTTRSTSGAGRRASRSRSPLQLRGDRPQLIEHVLAMGFTHIEFLPSWSTPSTVRGLPGDGLLRPDEPLRHAPAVHGAGRPAPPGRHRGHPRLGPSHFPTDPHGLASSTAPPLRARRPPDGLSPRLEQPDLQLRAATRCAPSSRRRQSSGWAPITPTPCGSTRWRPCSTATTHASRRVAAQRARRAREPRSRLLPLPAQCRHLRGPPRRPDHRRGVDGVARRPRTRPTSGASASASSGTWAGCTTTLEYFAQTRSYRRYHHGELTFRSIYAFTRTSSCRSPTTRSSTARAPCSTRCPATNG